ncbi:hypothetical protein EI94DRAFT_1233205 [Lactarius quietus]|nr:hypothetical protein EI94DRAFT_1233205 [Lactarius quietus]
MIYCLTWTLLRLLMGYNLCGHSNQESTSNSNFRTLREGISAFMSACWTAKDVGVLWEAYLGKTKGSPNMWLSKITLHPYVDHAVNPSRLAGIRSRLRKCQPNGRGHRRFSACLDRSRTSVKLTADTSYHATEV